MNLASILIGPITDVLTKAIPDATKRDAAKAEIEKALIGSQDKALEAMSATMAADAASEGWLTRNARPAVVIWSLIVISYVTLTKDMALLNTLSSIPKPLWDLITLGTGMYMASRGLEKTVGGIVNAIKK